MSKRAVLGILCCLGVAAQEKPVALYSGIGAWTHPIATRNAEAQKYFDQGLALLYGFNRYESLRSFQKAAQLDPQGAMAQWGMAMALGPYVNMDGDPSYDLKESCAAVKRGLALHGVGEVERTWLNAAGARCPDFADPSKYVRAMRDLAAKYPDDLDAQTLYAEALMVPTRWHWYSNDGKPAAGESEAERVLEAVMRRAPNHAGANHLYIHAVESSQDPERAVPSAQKLMGIVPSEGHMVHMPGHIWLVTGDYDNAVSVNERAVLADKKYMADSGVGASGSYYPYYLHNISFILYSRAMQGRIGATRAAEKQMAEALAPMDQSMAGMVDSFEAMIEMAELRNYRWDQMLVMPPPRSGKGPAVALWRFGRAMAMVGKGVLDHARKERGEFEALRKTIDPKADWGQNKTGDVMALASMILVGKLEANPLVSIMAWKRAVAMEDALVYDEPPAWYYPVRESLGAAMLRANDAAGAEAVFHEGLRRSPNNGRMLFGLLESLKAQKKSAAAAEVQKEFERAWAGADVKLRLADL